MIYCFVDEPNSQDQPHHYYTNIMRILKNALYLLNIYQILRRQTGLHSGWDITRNGYKRSHADEPCDRKYENISEEEPEGTGCAGYHGGYSGAGENNEKTPKMMAAKCRRKQEQRPITVNKHNLAKLE